MDDDGVGIGTIDAGRKNKIEGPARTSYGFLARLLIAEIPNEKLQKMRATGGFYGMPNDCAAQRRRIFSRGDNRKICDFLREEVNFAGIILGEAYKNFG